MTARITWPEGKLFAFTVFDDTDSQTLENGKPVYDFLADWGFRTTKSVWPLRSPRHTEHSDTCDNPEYLRWVQALQAHGFEIGYHMAASCTSTREETSVGMQRFRSYFGHFPITMANHYACDENIYFGDRRVSGLNRLLYNVVTGFKNHNRFRGDTRGDPLFWGDICQERIKYVRNFVFADINTLKVCPLMPYYDPDRPYVKYWFASSEGANVDSFNQRLTERDQERLVEEGGACIMYTHFGLGFSKDGTLNTQFRRQMESLAKKSGWFVPVSTLLDYLLEKKGSTILTAEERSRLERRWLIHKIRFGSA